MKLIKALALLLPIFFFIGCASPASNPTTPETSVDAVENANAATTAEPIENANEEATAEESIENAQQNPGSLIDRYISGEVSSD